MTESNMARLTFSRNIDQIIVLSRVIPVDVFKRSQKLLPARHAPATLKEYEAVEKRPVLPFAPAMIAVVIDKIFVDSNDKTAAVCSAIYYRGVLFATDAEISRHVDVRPHREAGS